MNEKLNALFTPFYIGKEKIKNRFVMGPMGITRLLNGSCVLTDEVIEYFVERARGDWGAIITGVMMAEKEGGVPTPLENPTNFYAKSMVMNEHCATYGTKVISEIGLGVGRNYPTFVAPSAVEVYRMPQMLSPEISVEYIHKKRDAMIQTAALMKRSGYAGVDVHTLHWGYLLDEFALSITNHREDEYGGSLENRLRLCREIVEGIKQVCGQDYPVTIGLGVKSFISALNKASLTGENEAGRTLEEGIEIAKMLEAMGYDAIMTDTGVYDSFYYACPPCYMPKGYGLPLYEQIKKAVSIPVLARARMGDPYLCAEALAKGQADGFVMSRPALADAFFPKKVRMGQPEKIRPCIGCNMGCISTVSDTGKVQSCAVNPRAFRELHTKPKLAVHPRSIAVVGGGPGGMEAAIVAAECGHKVELFEKTDALGGELNAAGAHQFKEEIYELRDWFKRELEEKNIPVHMNTEFTADMADPAKYDTIIIASGASAILPKSIEGIDKAISAVDLLENHRTVGEKVVVVGAGMIGCETAVDLAMKGKKVTLVEALPAIMAGEFVPTQHKGMLNDMLDHYKVERVCAHKLVSVTDTGAVVESVSDGERKELSADDVIISIGLKPNPTFASELNGKGIDVYEIGSARRAGSVIHAVHDAFEVVYNFE